jgi:two-component system sensor histidine kinase AlgZ
MQPSTVPSARPIEIVIPDCCNIGVIFRTLAAVNTAVLVAVLLRTNGLQAGWAEFLESSIVVELACIPSLLALCGLRRLIRAMPAWAQRAGCALVPAAVTSLVISFLSTFQFYVTGFSNLTMVKGVVAAALFGIVLQHYFELRTRAFSPALVEAQLQALHARIRPHFLFNSLNAVLSLIRSEPRQAEATLEDLADLFRVLLRDARDMTTMEDELRLCRQYLSIEKVRLGERLQLRWQDEIGPEVLGKARIPLLLLQPLLENAVRYGVEPASEPVLIEIILTRNLDRIEVAVLNPYHGDSAPMDGLAGNHMALDNIRERLRLLYDVEAQLATTVADGRFEVRLRFPYVKSA